MLSGINIFMLCFLFDFIINQLKEIKTNETSKMDLIPIENEIDKKFNYIMQYCSDVKSKKANH